MRFVAVDWGTSRCRAFLVDAGAVRGRAESEEGISRLAAGRHRDAFNRLCGAWLAAEPDLRVALVGMVGSREGWFPAPYVPCPAGPDEVAAVLSAVDLGAGARAFVVPGALCDAGGAVDVMRGEETHLLGAGVADGLVCLPGTHCKWAEMRDGRIAAFATFMTGEMHALLREHSMIGRPASEPADASGFGEGIAATLTPSGARASQAGLLNLLFGARAATVAGRMAPARLGPYLSGLLTGEEVAGALARFGRRERITIVADEARAELYRHALEAVSIATDRVAPQDSLLRGVARILDARA